MRMKITDIKCIPVSYKVPQEKRHRTDTGWVVKFDNNYIIVETSDGVTGYGATFGSALTVKTIVEKYLKPLLLGEDPTMIERLWMKMYCGPRGEASLERGYSIPSVNTRGETMCAISGVDIALWDILAKSLGQPLYKVLGGARTRIKAYASGGWQTADRIGDELGCYVTKGYKAVKMRAEGREGSFTIRKSVERVRAARDALGPDIEIYVDAHASLDLAVAIKYAKELEEYQVGWLEEPITQDDHASLKILRAHTTTPIATGERETSRFGIHSLLCCGGVDILQPDLGMCGGLTEGKRIAGLASAYGLKLATHNWGNPVIAAVSLHYALSQPAYSIFEVGQSTSPFMTDALMENLDIRDGYVYPSTQPGIGVEFRPDYFERYPYLDCPEWES